MTGSGKNQMVVLVAALAINLGAVAADNAGDIAETAFAARSTPSGATMFSTLAPEATGIVAENAYADPRMWTERYQELVFGAIGSGVAIGDYDSDGRPDIFVASKVEPARLFRNLGGWKFEDVTASAGLGGTAGGWTSTLKNWIGLGDDPDPHADAWKQGATFADVNNDGRLDLYVCRFAAPNQLFINQGDGTFKDEAAARGLAIVDASGMAAFCDYDRDGWLDVHLQTNMLDAVAQPGGRRDHLLRNNREGTFADVTTAAGIAGETCGHSATWWDFDEDGWPDLHVANDYAQPDFLYRNNRDGTFTNVVDQVLPHTTHYSMGADIGDVNNDGRLDLFVADMAPTTHEKDQRGMAGSRAFSQRNPDDSAAAPQYMRNALFLATGTGAFQEAAFLAGLAATDWTWSVRFEDLDNDGRIDLHVTNGMSREYHNADLLERIIAVDGVAAQRRVMRDSPVLAETNLAYRNLGDLRFEPTNSAWGLAQTSVSFGSASGDLDGDGDLDLVFNNYQAGPTVLRNDCITGHRVTVTLRGTVSNRCGVGATVRITTAAGEQVRQLVLARGSLSNSEPILHFGLGEETRITRLTVGWPSGHVQTFPGLSVDRQFTITEPATTVAMAGVGDPGPASTRPATVGTQFTDVSEAIGFALPAREKMTDDPKAQLFVPIRFGRCGPALALGDLDGDRRDEAVLGATGMEPARILRRDAAGEFLPIDAPGFASVARLADGPLLIFDADGDGAQELLLTASGTASPAGAPEYQPRLLLNDGRGAFRSANEGALPAVPLSAGAVVATDFDRDGRLDVFLGARVLPGRYPLPPRSALLRNRGGRFEDVTDALAPGLREVGLVTAALWSDTDGDGWPDLLVALEWGHVRVFRNREGRGLEDTTGKSGFAAAGTGWWTSLAAEDFNRDGRPDYVAGNLGLNTRYQASAEHPAVAFYGEFGGSGGPLFIEAHWDGDRLVPWRTRKELGMRLPTILRRFPHNDDYARATLGEILGEDRLLAARRFSATEFCSGVFLSQPDGSHRFEPLPRMAQIAPWPSVVAGDFDGDGNADIYALQNSFAPDATIGRFDGGLSQLLRGDGRGKFVIVPPTESGLVVAGDARAVVVTDLDGDGRPDFLVTRNNRSTLAFRNGNQR